VLLMMENHSYDNGKIDGFVITSQAESMGYW
jgi:phospholipase C